jgi:hypothetical protein
VQETPFIVTLRREGYSILDQSDPRTLKVLPNPTDPVPATQSKEGVYIPETKHGLSGTILVYWQQNGGAGLFGLPLTEPFAERNADDGKTYTVQYFERARFELHPDQGNAERVELGLLGKLAAKGREQEGAFRRITAANTASRRFFSEVGHTLSGAFKAYWEEHGGLVIFGLPISEPFDEKSATDGKTYRVQYFERNRFELHDGTGDTGSVSLGLLGSEALRQRGWLG